MTIADLWYGTSGPKDAEIVLVGEAWGSEEQSHQLPFVGSSGTELDRILAEAGIRRNDILVTNTVAARPHMNNMWEFFFPKDEEDPAHCIRGLYPTELVRNELGRLEQQIMAHPRKLVIACGNYALWALSNCTRPTTARKETGFRRTPTGIGNWRGSMWYTHGLNNIKLLPIYHPAAIMRAWDTRAVTVHDLKSRVPMALLGQWRPQPEPVFLAPPTYQQCISKLDHWLRRAQDESFVLAADVETVRQEFISCFGFADSVHFAMSIPFLRPTGPKTYESYWTPLQEANIVLRIRKLLTHPSVRFVGQNFLYDIQYCIEWFDVTPHVDFDTMLAQNVIFPGTPKDLGYLSSLYCKYHWYWKDDHKDWNSVDDLPSLLSYNCLDNIRTYEVAESQRNMIAHLGMDKQMHDMMRIAGLCLRMMKRGVRFDRSRALHLAVELAEARAKVHEKLERMVPQSVVGESKSGVRWYTSDRQTATLFYDILGFPVVKDRKTGNPTVSKEALNILPKKMPIWKPMFEALKLERSLENSYNVISSKIDRDGRMRCYFSPSTETMRLSSSKNAFGRGMNLMNLTKGKED